MIWKNARGSAPTGSPFRHYSDGLLGGRDVASDFRMNARLALGLSLLFAAPALAQTRPATRPPGSPPLLVSRLSTSGDYAVYGHGNSSCAAWSATQPGTPSRDLFLAWVQGFLTGTGGFNDEQRKTDTEGIQASMTTYCQAHPLDTIEVAASTLFVSLIGAQSASAPERRPSSSPRLPTTSRHSCRRR